MIRTTLIAALLGMGAFASGAQAEDVMINWDQGVPIAGDGAPHLSKLCEENPQSFFCRGFENPRIPLGERPNGAGKIDQFRANIVLRPSW